MNPSTLLRSLGLHELNTGCTTGTQWINTSGAVHTVYSPVDGSVLARVQMGSVQDYEKLIPVVQAGFEAWRQWPAPKRGEVVRQIGEALRTHKEALGTLVTLEMGKILQEGLGEVQEMIDICDYATGLSRQLFGLTMHSERFSHRMYEQWHPLGITGIISAFNFPVAVWSWNAMIAAVCGNASLWKPSEKTPLTALACQKIIEPVLQRNQVPEGVFALLLGKADVGSAMAQDKRVPLVSATGSTRMGRAVGKAVGERLGRSLLELGGNNAIIISEHANLELALRAVVFGAVGTCGQRCTSTRRLIIHEKIYDAFVSRLKKAYQQLPIGNPLHSGTLVGPLIDKDAVQSFLKAQQLLIQEGGTLLTGGEVLQGTGFENGCYVQPVLAEAKNEMSIVQEETFAPILYLLKYSGSIDQAIAMQNAVPQGLSSSLFTTRLDESETFLAHWGSDCGIANINIGTSGAEIGGAFGGEKDTGGGRESGSDSWKAYMRRQTNTINFSRDLPLAQGIVFNLE
ncbi:MAG: aldehyde dehydrogenase family protein [Cytophagaceae bacterium]|nr:aldehyde dehydrogenase family protein [Cytophagaceae bacterium]